MEIQTKKQKAMLDEVEQRERDKLAGKEVNMTLQQRVDPQTTTPTS